MGTSFILKLPTLDTITDQIKALGRGCKLYKVDISRAFRHVKLYTKEYDLLGLSHDCYYVDTCLLFGCRNESALFQCLSNAVCHIMRQCQYDVINYIDDILGIDLPKLTPLLTHCINYYKNLVSKFLRKNGIPYNMSELLRYSYKY